MRIVTRNDWGATVPTGPAMNLPAREFWLHHQGGRAAADPHQAMRNVEATGKQRFGRYSYSYAWHPANGGTILEGAGLTIGAHTGGRNSTSLAVCLLGDFDAQPCPDEAVRDVGWLIRHLIDTGALRPGTYPSGGHRDLKQTACPGDNAYRRIGEMRSAAANSTTPTPDQEDDMTPEQTKQLDQLHKAIIGGTDARGNRTDRHVAATDRTEAQVQWLVQEMRKLQGVSQADFEAQLIDIAEQRDGKG